MITPETILPTLYTALMHEASAEDGETGRKSFLPP